MRPAAMLVAWSCVAGCHPVVAPAPLELTREVAECHLIRFSARAPARPAVDLVIAVNGAVCHREPMVAGAPFERYRAFALCPADAAAPGENRVEVQLAPRQPTCAPPLVRRVARCVGPEPD